MRVLLAPAYLCTVRTCYGDIDCLMCRSSGMWRGPSWLMDVEWPLDSFSFSIPPRLDVLVRQRIDTPRHEDLQPSFTTRRIFC